MSSSQIPVEALQDQCVELMSTKFPEDSSEILEPESEAPIVTVSANKKIFWAVATDYSSTAISDNSFSNSREIRSDYSWESIDLKTVISVLVSILAIIAMTSLLHSRDRVAYGTSRFGSPFASTGCAVCLIFAFIVESLAGNRRKYV